MKLLCLIIPVFLLSLCEFGGSVNKPINSFPIKKEKKAFVLDYDTLQWSDLGLLDSGIILDIRYATTNNFVEEKMYPCGRCFLRQKIARAILKAQQQLQKKGWGLKIFDCYRPIDVQEKLWQKVPNASYVTPPRKGSMHNRGVAVDLTIVDSVGIERDMGTSYDFFGPEAHHNYALHSDEVKANRLLLRSLMESVGLSAIRTEWWHYSYRKGTYEISNMQWNCRENETE